MAVQFEELHGWGIFELDAEVAGDLAQAVIQVRKVVNGHVANESTADFVVTGAAMQPAKKEEQLQARGKANHDPVGVHRSLGRGRFSLLSFGALGMGVKARWADRNGLGRPLKWLWKNSQLVIPKGWVCPRNLFFLGFGDEKQIPRFARDDKKALFPLPVMPS